MNENLKEKVLETISKIDSKTLSDFHITLLPDFFIDQITFKFQ